MYSIIYMKEESYLKKAFQYNFIIQIKMYDLTHVLAD